LEVYAAQALNLDAEAHAAEIRIRAERKAGEILRETPKAKGTVLAGIPEVPIGGRLVRPPEPSLLKASLKTNPHSGRS
jgi:hypothetical protein